MHHPRIKQNKGNSSLKQSNQSPTMHSQALILPIAASIMLPLTSEAAFVSSTGRAPMHRRGQLSSPSPKTIHVNPTVTSSTSKSTALHSSFDDFGLLPSPEMGSSFLYSSIAMSASLIGTNTDFQDSTSQLHALNENINNALYDLEIQSTIMHTLAHAVDFSTLIVPEVPLLRTASLLARILSILLTTSRTILLHQMKSCSKHRC